MNNKETVRTIISMLLIVCMVFVFAGCGKKDTYDYHANLAGTYEVYHWFYDEANGDNGFYDEPMVYTFGSDGSFAAAGGDLEEDQSGTYEFTGDNTITVTFADGSFDNFTLRYSSDHDAIEMTNDATKLAASMERTN